MKKRLWIVAVAFGMMSVTAFAQTETAPAQKQQKTEQHTHKGHAGKQHNNLKEYEARLQLSPEQVSQWQSLNEGRKAEMKDLKENTTLSREDKRAHLKTMRKQKQIDLQKILSAEQYATYQEIQKEKMQERKAMRAKKAKQKKIN